MSILSSLKEERKLSFSHWRYRLLHWAFSVDTKKITHPSQTGLPMFLYTHYCPLFHLTNLIALLSPFILLFRVLAVVFWAFIGAVSMIDLSPLWPYVEKFFAMFKLPDRPATEPPPPPPPCKHKERSTLLSLLAGEWTGKADEPGFDRFWGAYGRHFQALTEDEAKAVYMEVMPKVLDARERHRQRKEAFRQRLIFWTNFSQVFLKWALNVAYVLLAIGLAYGLFVVAVPAFNGVCWVCSTVCGFFAGLFSDASFFNALKFLAKVFFYLLLAGGVIFGVVWGGLKVGFYQRFAALCHQGLVTISPPFFVVGRFFSWVGKCWDAALEFVAMFYEENCPKVTIVTEEEAILDKVEKGGD